jgi:Calcineurin-like phosphoesterase/Purple acid Phosphatase, N-terminal domain
VQKLTVFLFWALCYIQVSGQLPKNQSATINSPKNILASTVTRGPYLQLPTPTSMQVRWRTSDADRGQVSYSLSSAGPWTTVTAETVAGTDHSLNVVALAPNTKYFYKIDGLPVTGPLITYESGPNYFFTTPPTGNDPTKTTRIWVTGDPSEDSSEPQYLPRQDEVLAGFKAFQAANPSAANLDLWMLLGDNAYLFGNDTEYQNTFFNPYDDMNAALPSNNIMKQTPILPCLGNHDYYGGGAVPGYNETFPTDVLNQLVPGAGLDVINPFPGAYNNSLFRFNKNNSFFSIFSMPTNGGKYSTANTLAGNKGFYSYNHNNIHFVCLDSYGFYNDYILYGGSPVFPATTSPNPQIQWLINDLTTNTQKWTIMYWHHAPYTHGGGHNSDSELSDEFILKGIRTKFIKYLDEANFKIDLVLNGHSHAYERSKLLKGHHGDEATFSAATHNSNLAPAGGNSFANSNGKFTSGSSCPYVKSSTATVNEGAVYVVTGSAGQIQPSSAGEIRGHLALNGASFGPATATDRGTIQELKGGSVYIEVKDNRLDLKFIEETTGAVTDNFTMFKDVNTNSTIVKNISPLDLPTQTPDLQLINPFGSVNSYTISSTAMASSVSSSTGVLNFVNPQIGPIYTVTEGAGCLTQKITFQFDSNCWPAAGVTINNLIDSPLPIKIRSLGKITGQNIIKPGSKVNYESVSSVNLNTSTPNNFYAMPGSVFSATRIAACP